MKKLCLALVMVAAMAGSSWAEGKILSNVTEKEFTVLCELFSTTEKFKKWKTKEVVKHSENDVYVLNYSHSKYIESFIDYDKETSEVKRVLFSVSCEELTGDKKKNEEVLLRFLNCAEEAMSFAFTVAFYNHDLKKEFFDKIKDKFGPQNLKTFEGIVSVTYEDIGIQVRSTVDKDSGRYILHIVRI